MKFEFSNQISDYIELGKIKEKNYERKIIYVQKICFYLFLIICIINIILSLQTKYTFRSQILNIIITVIVISLWIILFKQIPQITQKVRTIHWKRLIKNNPKLLEKKHVELTDKSILVSGSEGKLLFEINIKEITEVLIVNDIIIIYFGIESKKAFIIPLHELQDETKEYLLVFLKNFISEQI